MTITTSLIPPSRRAPRPETSALPGTLAALRAGLVRRRPAAPAAPDAVAYAAALEVLG